MGFTLMLWCSLGFVITLELLTAIVDHLRLGAAFTSERGFNTGLPVDSDLIRNTGSSLVPSRVTLPPLGPVIVARVPAVLVTTP